MKRSTTSSGYSHFSRRFWLTLTDHKKKALGCSYMVESTLTKTVTTWLEFEITGWLKKQLEQMFKTDIRKIFMLTFNRAIQVAALCNNRRKTSKCILFQNREAGSRLCGLYRLVEKSGHILLFVSVCCTENHHAILDGEGVQVIEHHVVWLWKECRVTRDPRVLVEQHLQQVRR